MCAASEHPAGPDSGLLPPLQLQFDTVNDQLAVLMGKPPAKAAIRDMSVSKSCSFLRICR